MTKEAKIILECKAISR
jgi:hypothetical protein